MTLVEFLLARIAEDEAKARNAALNSDNALRGGSIARQMGFPPERVLAECKVKRALVEYSTGPRNSTGPEWTREIRILATLYAGHPDYQPEWAA